MSHALILGNNVTVHINDIRLDHSSIAVHQVGEGGGQDKQIQIDHHR